MTDQDDLRAGQLDRLAHPNWGNTAPTNQTVVNVINQKKRVHHGFHLFMTLITAGLWLPVWVIVAIAA